MDKKTVVFATAEEFSKAAEGYFTHCDAQEDLYGEAGVCLWLSSHNPGGAIVTQQTLRSWYDGEACPWLRDAVRLAYLRIQHQIETDPRYQGKGGMTSKAVLLLKQSRLGGYADRPEQKGDAPVKVVFGENMEQSDFE